MTIAPGTKLGRYEIRSKIGAGGMGEVYLAEDTRLHRKVALKILSSELMQNKDRLRRFELEAQSAAALNHPNIAHIYEIGEHDGVHFIAMEFVDGPTLREKIHRERTELRKLLRYLQQVAEGLAKAHAAGIVHRDLKPDNIMITRDGYAKILDFGLAKLIEPMGQKPDRQGGLNEVATAILQQHSTPGMIMGTAGYMSPEQAQGKVNEIDHRSDIFSFGCILFETATGRKAFEGKDVLHSLHKIVHAPTPQISDINPTAPPELQRIVRRCLAKDPEKRYQSIKDVAIELEELRQGLQDSAQQEYSAAPQRSSEAGQFGTSDVEFGVQPSGGQLSGATSSTPEGGPPSLTPPTSSAEIIIGEIKRHKTGAIIILAALAVVIAGIAFGIYTKKLLADVYSPVTFSPDGRRLAFVRSASEEDSLIVANADGTGEQTLATLHSPESFSGGGTVYLPSLGGPAWSPDGKVIACPATVKDDRDSRGRRTTVVEVRVADATIKAITSHSFGRVERIVWLHDGGGLVMVVREERDNEQIWYLSYPGGEGQRITHDLSIYGDVSLTADSNTLVAVQVDPLSNVWVTPLGQGATNAKQITNGKLDGYCGLSWTPDGKIVYVSRKIRDADLWIMNADGGNQKQLTDDVYLDRFPSVTPDGRYIVFDSWRGGGIAHIWRMDIDGGNLKQLTNSSGDDVVPHCSPDGKWVVYQGTGPSIWKVSIDGGQPIQLTNKLTARPTVSPDGKLVACFYREDRNSPWKIAVIPFEGGQLIKVFDTPVPTSYFPVLRWTADGRAILYADDRNGVGNIWGQPVDGSPPKQITDFKSDFINTFDLSRDGRLLVVARGSLISDIVMMSRSK